MRVLWLTYQVPYPANSGELLYTRGLTESLAIAGAEVHALAAGTPPTFGAAVERPVISGLSWRAVEEPLRPRWQSLWRSLPSGSFRLATRALRSLVNERLQRGGWSALVIDQAANGWVLPLWQRIAARPPLVYVAHNVESHVRPQFAARTGRGMRGAVLRWDAWKYSRLEQQLLRAASLVTAITPEDAEVFSRQIGGRDVVVLTPGASVAKTAAPDTVPPRRVILSGSYEWVAKQHNVRRFLASALPVLQPTGVAVTVVGKMPDSFAAELRREFPAAEIHANVPDPAPFLASARIGVIPEEAGGGFKLKALEYVFRHLPIAALPGTLAGLPVDSATDALIAPTLDGLARRLSEVIDEPEYLRTLAARAYEKCDGRFEWAERGSQLYAALTALRNDERR
jgi:glycosyltransferase involved in cell wall biosynthesis